MNSTSEQKITATKTKNSHRCIFLRKTPRQELDAPQAALPGLPRTVLQAMRYEHLPLLAVVIDEQGLPVWPASLFLASSAITSNGATGDTVRTYGESLLPWLDFIKSKKHTLHTVDEETLKLYRVKCVHGASHFGRKYSSATANLRINVAVQFHRWCEENKNPSPLGNYLLNQHTTNRALSPRVINKLPRILSLEETQRIMHLSKNPYRLMMRWGLVTGLRRLEVSNLKKIELPSTEEIAFFSDGLARLDIMRKGGRTTTAYAPMHLVEETNWYILTERPPAKPDFDEFVFINTQGRNISRQAVSREFRRCANEIGSSATLHHLRHTFAAHVLNFLENHKNEESTNNTVKAVQVLLGHARMETTEIYLRALEVTDNAVVDALEHLYGGDL